MTAQRSISLSSALFAALLLLPTSGAFADVPTSARPDSLSSWVSVTTHTVQNAAVYPDSARELAHEGSPEMKITVDREGRVLNVSLTESSGYDDLDCAADSLVQTLTFPALPEGYSGNKLTFHVSVNYDLMSYSE